MSLVLPGWDCPHCKVFNGEVKEPRERCRTCDAYRPIPSAGTWARTVQSSTMRVTYVTENGVKLAADVARLDVEMMADAFAAQSARDCEVTLNAVRAVLRRFGETVQKHTRLSPSAIALAGENIAVWFAHEVFTGRAEFKADG